MLFATAAVSVLATAVSAYPHFAKLGVPKGALEGRLVAREADADVAAAATTGSSNVPAGHAYVAPSSTDSRSPCPGLNSLANHNFLPHDGRALTVPILIKGLADGLNVGADFTTAIGSFGTLANPNPLAGQFDLEQLKKHNFPIEHDASLSRKDLFQGDNLHFDNATWQTVVAYTKGSKNFNFSNAGPARYNRVQTQAKSNPTFTYTPQQFVLSYGETALYLSTMGDPTTGIAPVDYVRSLFEKERLPYELGWSKPVQQTTLLSLGAMIFELNAATGEPLPEGLILTQSTLKNALSGLPL